MAILRTPWVKWKKYSKPVLSSHLKIDKTKIFWQNGSLMKVKSIAECSHWSILQYFWPALSDNWSWKPFLGIFESGRFRQVLLYQVNESIPDILSFPFLLGSFLWRTKLSKFDFALLFVFWSVAEVAVLVAGADCTRLGVVCSGLLFSIVAMVVVAFAFFFLFLFRNLALRWGFLSRKSRRFSAGAKNIRRFRS